MFIVKLISEAPVFPHYDPSIFHPWAKTDRSFSLFMFLLICPSESIFNSKSSECYWPSEIWSLHSLPLTTKTYLPNIWQLPIFQIFSAVMEGKMKFIDISCRYTHAACIWKISRYTANSSGFGPLLVIFYPVWCLQVLN